MTNLRILGIDPGFERLGVCVLDKNIKGESLVYSACLETSKKDSLSKRLVSLGKELEFILKKYKPQELAIETIFFTTNQKTIIPVAEVRGVCIYLSQLYKLDIYEYSPPEIKLAIAGHGRGTKSDIAHMVPKILTKQIKNDVLDDEMDAIAIALTHSSRRKIVSWK